MNSALFLNRTGQLAEKQAALHARSMRRLQRQAVRGEWMGNAQAIPEVDRGRTG